ncbi:MAG: helix-turn-helix domain-containing protein [Chloroflexi bacterium]|nr:helix-turn-helix domain-containing protein [Chloroflexota bacterium]MDA1269656.1 helix-turn-helix domain-containing protein [Chloroflexota bacterium]
MIYEPNKCPIRFGLGAFGDRWTLLIIRDMMFRGYSRFRDFLDSGEGISTNVLSNRLSRLEAQQIITRQKDPANGRQVLYNLTDRGKDLLPVMLAMIGWAEKYDSETNISSELGEQIRIDLFGARDEMLAAMKHSSPRT